MTQTWRLVAVGATAAAALALAIGTASARAAKVIIIRDGSVEILGGGTRLEPKGRFKHRTNMRAREIAVFLDAPDAFPCSTEVASERMNPANVLRLDIADPNGQIPLFIAIANHREQGNTTETTGLAFGEGWRFAPAGNRWALTDENGNTTFHLQRVSMHRNPNDATGKVLAEARQGYQLCVQISE